MGISCNNTTNLVTESSAHSLWLAWHRPNLSLLFWGNYSGHFLSLSKELVLENKLFVVQYLNCIWLFAMPWTAAHQASLSFTISQSLLKLMSIELVMPSNHLVLCHPLLLPSVFPSIRVFSNESALCIRWSKYWRFSFSTSPSNDYSELISFRID